MCGLEPCAEGSAQKLLVGLGGLEPPTSPLSGARSNHLSYRPSFQLVAVQHMRASRVEPASGLLVDAGVLCGRLGMGKSFLERR